MYHNLGLEMEPAEPDDDSLPCYAEVIAADAIYNCSSRRVIVPRGDTFYVTGPDNVSVAMDDPEEVVMSLGLAYPGNPLLQPV